MASYASCASTPSGCGRSRLLRLGPAVAVFLVVVGSVAWGAPSAFRGAARAISDWAGMGTRERELAPARFVGVDPRVLTAARRLIPPGAVYHVEAGHPTPGLAYPAYRPLSFYWLFPRRYTNDASRAGWILSYGNSLERLPLSYSRVWRIEPGVAVAKVRR